MEKGTSSCSQRVWSVAVGALGRWAARIHDTTADDMKRRFDYRLLPADHPSVGSSRKVVNFLSVSRHLPAIRAAPWARTMFSIREVAWYSANDLRLLARGGLLRIVVLQEEVRYTLHPDMVLIVRLLNGREGTSRQRAAVRSPRN